MMMNNKEAINKILSKCSLVNISNLPKNSIFNLIEQSSNYMNRLMYEISDNIGDDFMNTGCYINPEKLSLKIDELKDIKGATIEYSLAYYMALDKEGKVDHA